MFLLSADFIHEVDEGKQRLELYIKAVDREISKRRQVIELLTHGSKYYESLLGEANIVANVRKDSTCRFHISGASPKL